MQAYIPPNIDQSGYILYGMVKTRNAVEAGIFGVITYAICAAALVFLPYTLKLTLTVLLTAVVAFFFAHGMDEKSVLTAVADRYRFRLRKSVTTLGVPMPEEQKESFFRKLPKKGEK